MVGHHRRAFRRTASITLRRLSFFMSEADVRARFPRARDAGTVCMAWLQQWRVRCALIADN